MPWEYSSDGMNHFFDVSRPLPLWSTSIHRLTSTQLDGKPDCTACRAAESLRQVDLAARGQLRRV